MIAPVIKTVRTFSSRLAENKTARGSVVAFAIKVAGSSLSIAMFTIAARVMQPAEFGHFAIWFNAVSFLAMIALCGQETLIVRSWSEYLQQHRFAYARGAITFGLAVCVAAALFLAGCLAVASSAAGWAASPDLVVAACLFLILQTVVWFSSNVARTIVGFLFGEGLRETWRLVVVGGASALAFANLGVTTTTIFALGAIGIGLTIWLQTKVILRAMPPETRGVAPATHMAAWIRRSLPMWAATVLDASSLYLEVILIGLVLTPVAAGGYFVAARLANMFAMIAGGMANYSATLIAPLFFGGQHPQLQQSLRMVSLTVAALVAIGLLAIFAFGDFMLMIFGKSYVDQHAILMVLSVGTAVAALGGPAIYVLLLTGHEGLYSRVVVVGLVLRCVALVVFTPKFGAIAAAIAWAASLIGTTVALNLVCRRLVGIDPSVMALFDTGATRVTAGRTAAASAPAIAHSRHVES